MRGFIPWSFCATAWGSVNVRSPDGRPLKETTIVPGLGVGIDPQGSTNRGYRKGHCGAEDLVQMERGSAQQGRLCPGCGPQVVPPTALPSSTARAVGRSGQLCCGECVGKRTVGLARLWVGREALRNRATSGRHARRGAPG